MSSRGEPLSERRLSTNHHLVPLTALDARNKTKVMTVPELLRTVIEPEIERRAENGHNFLKYEFGPKVPFAAIVQLGQQGFRVTPLNDQLGTHIIYWGPF